MRSCSDSILELFLPTYFSGSRVNEEGWVNGAEGKSNNGWGEILVFPRTVASLLFRLRCIIARRYVHRIYL